MNLRLNPFVERHGELRPVCLLDQKDLVQDKSMANADFPISIA